MNNFQQHIKFKVITLHKRAIEINVQKIAFNLMYSDL